MRYVQGTPYFFSAVLARPPSRAGALSTPVGASEDASFTNPKFDFLTSKPVLARCVCRARP